MKNQQCLVKGIVECIGLPEAYFHHRVAGEEEKQEPCKAENHQEAIKLILDNLTNQDYGVIKNTSEIAAVGHRVVHGGEKFSQPVAITAEVIDDIRECFSLAPLHNPPNYQGIEAVNKLLPGVLQVAVFDTAFHQTIPPAAYIYGLPYAIYQKYNIRRYGFHGSSHQYVATRAAEILNRPLTELRLITCHLGNGSSITAIAGGKSVDTSMGFTPLEGLVMGTRCGDIDPAIIPHILRYEHISPDALYDLLNKKSGVLGISGISNDMRALLKAESSGNSRAKLAIDVFCYRIKKYIGSYLAVLNGAEAIVFTAGIGENSPTVRERSCRDMENLGIVLDKEKNLNTIAREGIISHENSPIKVLVIPTNEELLIASETYKILTNKN